MFVFFVDCTINESSNSIFTISGFMRFKPNIYLHTYCPFFPSKKHNNNNAFSSSCEVTKNKRRENETR